MAVVICALYSGNCFS